MDIPRRIATTLNLPVPQISAAIELMDAGNTLPFIARYRKEATSSLDEEQLRQIDQALARLRALEKRRETILATILEQDRLTPELKSQIMAAEAMTVLEDLDLPYKPKRRTRASLARERGLQPLADLIITQPVTRETAEQMARRFLNDEVPSVEDALAGARDIVAETISEHPGIRGQVREKALRYGRLQSSRIDDADDPKTVFGIYYQFDGAVSRLRPHQILAINRGEKCKVLRV